LKKVIQAQALLIAAAIAAAQDRLREMEHMLGERLRR